MRFERNRNCFQVDSSWSADEVVFVSDKTKSWKNFCHSFGKREIEVASRLALAIKKYRENLSWIGALKHNKQPLPATVESNPRGIRFELDDDEQNKESLKCTPATTYTHLRKVRRYLFGFLSFCDRFAVQWTWATHAMSCRAVPQRQPSWNNSN